MLTIQHTAKVLVVTVITSHIEAQNFAKTLEGVLDRGATLRIRYNAMWRAQSCGGLVVAKLRSSQPAGPAPDARILSECAETGMGH